MTKGKGIRATRNKEKRVRIQLYLPPDIKDEIEGIASRNNKTLGRIAGAFIMDGLRTYRATHNGKAPKQKAPTRRKIRAQDLDDTEN